MKTTVREILKGTKLGKLQTVGMMQVLPLIGEIQFDKFASPLKNSMFSTNEYGSMNWKNLTSKVIIVPTHTSYMIKEQGQDHALPASGIISKNSSRNYNTAACIQETCGGHISPSDYDFSILPFSIREPAIRKRNETKYGKLWSDIKIFNNATQITEHSAHLEYFFDKFKEELNEFVAEFENITFQVGAIIFINGIIAGIERTPNSNYWNDIWRPLIRGCYGSCVIENIQQKRKLDTNSIERMRVPLDLTKIESISDLEKQFKITQKKQKSNVIDIIKEYLDESLSETIDEIKGNLNRNNLENSNFIGQAVREEEAYVYASLISKKSSLNSLKWKAAEKFEI